MCKKKQMRWSKAGAHNRKRSSNPTYSTRQSRAEIRLWITRRT
jgi:hypothetical protein